MDNTKETIHGNEMTFGLESEYESEATFGLESESEYSSSDSEPEDIPYPPSKRKEESSSESEWDPEDDYEPEEFPIIATDTDGNETTFENSYKASETLGIRSADIIKCCKNIRGYEYITVNDKKYSYRGN